jgi:thiosulfate dehydrogenase
VKPAMRLPASILLLVLLGACGDREVPAAEFGRERFNDPRVSTSRFNPFSCADCHVVDPAAPVVVPGRLDSGYNLAGAPTRGGWWGGGSPTLLDAINVCIKEFMGGGPLARDSDAARQLDAYLEANSPPTGMPAPFTFVRTTGPLTEVPGDAARGKVAYQNACHRCHGEIHTWKGHSTPIATLLPESTLSRFAGQAREVTVEKIRHGRFINIGGVMPFYTAEVMSDQTVADILVYMGL